jgi:proteasome lid subunit RPN8/RPN11
MFSSIEKVLTNAVQACVERTEEEGGVIMKRPKNGRTEFAYYRLRNSNTGTDIAPSLWTADRNEYAQKIIPLFKEGWTQWASFHTHPQFLPFPSGIDIHTLFPGFAVNVIYSPVTKELTRWSKSRVEDENKSGVSIEHTHTYMFSTVHNRVYTVHSPEPKIIGLTKQQLSENLAKIKNEL